jgi:hypothetical protein
VKRVFSNQDPDRGELQAWADSAGGVLLRCDRPGERAVSHALTPAQFESLVDAVRAAIAGANGL